MKIRIFDSSMNLVKELEGGQMNSGTYEAVWDGKDSKGRTLPTGPYIYIIELKDRQLSGKILLTG